MFDKLPKSVDPERLGQNGADFKGQYPLSAMSRLADIAESDAGQCEVDLALVYEGGRLLLRGELEAQVSLQCQRCLEDYACVLVTNVELELVREETDAHREYDVFVLDEDDGSLDLLGLVEDELLLQLPSMPKHEQIDDCNQDMIERATEYVPDEAEEEKKNPFAILKDLKDS